MLKTIPPTTSCGCGYFKTKCAEIHYQTTNFCILCIFCGMKTLDYTDFLEHFHNLHFEDFAKTLQCTAEPVVTTVFEKKKPFNDPLEFGEREVAEDPDEVIKKLKEERLEVKEIKRENIDTVSGLVIERNVFQCSRTGSPTADYDDFNDSDNEFLLSKVKVEIADIFAANPSKARTIKRRSSQNKCNKSNDDLVEEKEICDIPFLHNDTNERLKLHDNNNDDDDDHNDHSDSMENEESFVKNVTDEEDIDWTKPYEPNLLKNHDKRPYKPRNKPNLCTYCGRTFKRRYQLESHVNVHTGEKPHQCEICGRLFRAVTTLTRHLNTHEQRDSFICKFCNKAFTHKVALLSHELRHTQERTVPCDECDKWFYTANQMDTHKRKVHHKNDQDDLPFVCDICSKRYRTGSMLSTHKFKKHYKTAKYSCELCGKKFVDEQKLVGHKHIHINGYSSVVEERTDQNAKQNI